LRRFATTTLWLLLLIVGAGTERAQAQDGLVTFKFTNNAPYTVYMKMYSQDRGHVWPSATTHYILDDNDEHAARLACHVGEEVCYGGAYYTDGKGTYWGVGYNGNFACKECCLTCGTEDEDVWHSWNLTE